jgi:hypothetical protein
MFAFPDLVKNPIGCVSRHEYENNTLTDFSLLYLIDNVALVLGATWRESFNKATITACPRHSVLSKKVIPLLLGS